MEVKKVSELRAEAINLIENIPERYLAEIVSYVKNFLKKEDPFYSEENIAELSRRVEDMNNGRKIVSFSEEEWEKLINAQDIS